MKKYVVLGVVVLIGALVCCSVMAQEEATVVDSADVSEMAGKTYVCEKDGMYLDEPGRCPVCGNDLVEETVVNDEITEEPPDISSE
ncbi:heavy metal-binding domain-containing protein [Candidatus Auribacterota bacterium]